MLFYRTIPVLILSFFATIAHSNDADQHNVIRDALSCGKTLTTLGAAGNSTYDFSKQYRPSTRLPNLTISESLQNTASSYASQCRYAHSGTSGVGENLFTGTGSSWTVEDAINAFAYEVKGYTYGTVNGTQSCDTSDAAISSCGHYTQLVWENTTQVGCAVQFCSTLRDGANNPIFGGTPSTLIVCQYSSPGNYIGQTPYASAGVISGEGCKFTIAPVMLLLQ